MGIISTWIEKGRQIKSRGIALTHRDQGYSANNRPVSLLTKSDIDPEKLTVDIVKALEQVQLTISMEEFLRRFFDMWSSDAELLTKALGFKTEFEQNAEDNPVDDDSWEADWQERHRDYIDTRLESINIIKKAKDGADLTLIEQFNLIETRKAFESGCAELGLDFNTTTVTKPAVEVKAPVETQKAKTTTATSESSPGATKNTIEETPVDKEVDVTKSQAFIDLQKANAELMTQLQGMQGDMAAAKEIVKAAADARKAVAVAKAAEMSFVAEGQREAIATVILDPAQATVVAVLEKAVSDLKAKEEALIAKDLEIEEVKKSFADGKAIGGEGDLTKAAKGDEDAQAKLDRIIKAHAASMTTTA